MSKICKPDADTKVLFFAATAYVSKIGKTVAYSDRTSKHGGQKAKLDDGYILVEQSWWPGGKRIIIY